MKRAWILVVAGAVATFASIAYAQASGDPAALVDTFIGTGNGGKVTGNINMFPGAAEPFGMLTWSPATPSRAKGGGYSYKDHSILGFSLTHLSGPGCHAAGEIPILPTVGVVSADPDNSTSQFEHTQEHATPGEYQVVLAPGTPDEIVVKLTATTRTGIGEFQFPAAAPANFLFKVSDGQKPTATSTVNVVGNDALTGSETSGHFCRTSETDTLYFVAKFNHPFSAWGSWGRGGVVPDNRTATGMHTGEWVSFGSAHPRDILLKVAISYVSVADAWDNLKAEDPDWDFAAIASKAHSAWNRLLSRIAVSGGTHDQQVQFYTALYHTLLAPNVFSDDNGEYIGFDDKVHHLPNDQNEQYANFSGWDIYRSEIPLLSLLVPQRTGDMVTSLLNDAKQGGWLPKWGYDNEYTGVMNGDPADSIIAEAYAFGVRNFDAKAALADMVKGATYTPEPEAWSGTYVERPHLLAYERLGYVPGNTSETLEYAAADYAVARLARSLGDTATYRKFVAQSSDWKKVFDKGAKFDGFSGFMQVRDVDGRFSTSSVSAIALGAYGQAGFEEGNAIQYTWMVPQDLHGLILAMGGNKVAVARLDRYFEQLNVGPNEPYYWAGNEMCLGDPWVYDYAGAPWKTQAVVRQILKQVYAATPGGEPGNDDLGAMSSWLVWAYLGLYPETPGAPVLVTGAPMFPHTTVTLGNGHEVTITARRAPFAGYISALSVNGKPWSKDWFPVDVLLGSGANAAAVRLNYGLATQPSRHWGSANEDRPPSSSPGRSGGRP
ncbi:MAG: GH92 family glycosyl hydrolase [Rhodanobacteraceae bacterium]